MKSFGAVIFALATAASLVAATPMPKVDSFAVLDLAPRNTTVQDRSFEQNEVVKRNATALDKRLEGTK
ncbi:hypothetical protein MGN70_008787 [Eutypa lata]|uniref:RxLR effector protein n=1 Tax=Eutypa lata (strain UCR-EL1) TaxID=1287681 RepID=M7SU68_EUTLA|nr:hypothetical protein UCREL1_5181 [Eutypa lata UCREL1]KAI1249177.1 hypothetical protein MGN70_008787 [Eutypa lata]